MENYSYDKNLFQHTGMKMLDEELRLKKTKTEIKTKYVFKSQTLKKFK